MLTKHVAWWTHGQCAGLEVSSAAADFPGGDDHYDGKALVLFNRKAGKVKSCKIEPGHGMVQSSHSLFLLVAPDTAERDTWLAAIRRQIAHHEERASFQRPATHSLQPDATMTVLPTPDLDKLRGKLQSVGDASVREHCWITMPLTLPSVLL
jgi:hypothetical protein